MPIITRYENVRWGVNEIPGVENACTITLLDQGSGSIVEIPFGGDPLAELIGRLITFISEDHKRELVPMLNGGIHLPDKDFKPEDIILPRQGKPGGPPQG